MKFKKCSKCKKTKPINEFSKASTKKSGLACHCRACHRKKSKIYQLKNKERNRLNWNPPKFKRCSGCQKVKSYKKFHKSLRNIHGLVAYCKTCKSKIEKKRRAKRKKIVMEHYGSKCACCGEDKIEFLTLDHVNNDGSSHRKKMKQSGIGLSSFYDFLIQNNFPKETELQVLCMNCNFSKGHYGYCPHKTS